MKKVMLFLTVLFSLPTILCAQSKAPSHAIFHQLLKKNVSVTGQVNYTGFMKDSVEFNQYLRLLSQSPPDEKNWSRVEQMAYWINVYNAFTIKLILKYYPVKSIKDIGSSIQIPFVNTPWDIPFIVIGKEKLDLNNVEHGILRKKFNDPRIHMVLVCASKSCPVLLNEAYDPERLDAQLTTQTKAFLKDTTRNKISADRPQVSKIFSWYSGDFEKNGGSVKSFINQYGPVKISEKAKLSYLEYDWTLNE
ncbi:MAG: DUF547 domain-containing protein [Cyclobacteriaceae bacterium]|nr:DUF547 domain-containing protein [Cyclobacteriaceae bacterium]